MVVGIIYVKFFIQKVFIAYNYRDIILFQKELNYIFTVHLIQYPN